jgi:hypothetical protein
MYGQVDGNGDHRMGQQAAGRAEDNRGGMSLPCANCHKSDHRLQTCKGPLTVEGCLRGCPWCNSTAHSWDMCQKRVRNVVNDFTFEVLYRVGRAPLEMKEDWRVKHKDVLDSQLMRGDNRLPWTKQMASRNRMMPHRYMADHTMEKYVFDEHVIGTDIHQGSSHSVEYPGEPVALAFHVPPPEPDENMGMTGLQGVRSERDSDTTLKMVGKLVDALTEKKGYAPEALPPIPEHRATTSDDDAAHGGGVPSLGLRGRSRLQTSRYGLKKPGTELRKAVLSRQHGGPPVTVPDPRLAWSSDEGAQRQRAARLARLKVVSRVVGVKPAVSVNRKRSADAAKFPHNRRDGEAPVEDEDSESSEDIGGVHMAMHSHPSKRSRVVREERGSSGSATLGHESAGNVPSTGLGHASSTPQDGHGRAYENAEGRDPYDTGCDSAGGRDPYDTGCDSAGGRDPYDTGCDSAGGRDPYDTGCDSAGGRDPYDTGCDTPIGSVEGDHLWDDGYRSSCHDDGDEYEEHGYDAQGNIIGGSIESRITRVGDGQKRLDPRCFNCNGYGHHIKKCTEACGRCCSAKHKADACTDACKCAFRPGHILDHCRVPCSGILCRNKQTHLAKDCDWCCICGSPDHAVGDCPHENCLCGEIEPHFGSECIRRRTSICDRPGCKAPFACNLHCRKCGGNHQGTCRVVKVGPTTFKCWNRDCQGTFERYKDCRSCQLRYTKCGVIKKKRS